LIVCLFVCSHAYLWSNKQQAQHPVLVFRDHKSLGVNDANQVFRIVCLSVRMHSSDIQMAAGLVLDFRENTKVQVLMQIMWVLVDSLCLFVCSQALSSDVLNGCSV
jgi:hypothetical protein